MKKWIRYLILYQPARWVVTQLFFVTMLFSIIASITAVNQHNANKWQTDAATQGYGQVLNAEVNHVSDYTIDNESYYLIESDDGCILLNKNIILHDDIRVHRELTVFYKDSRAIDIQHEQQTADLLDAHSAMTDKPVMKIIWYIACGIWITAMLVCVITLTVVDLKAQHDEHQKNKGASNHGQKP